MNTMEINSIMQHFPPRLTETLLIMGTKDMQEIRIIAEKNASVIKRGILMDSGVCVSCDELRKIINSMCRGSLYAMQQNLTKGYITLLGGHRVGVCGKCVCENGIVTHMSDISAICIRLSRGVIGAANPIMEYILYGDRIYNTLIISPAGCGKTTILRDIARQIGTTHKVCIADERSEIAACKNGIPTHDVGRYTAVMDAVPKGEGITMLLRTMSPEVIITDETGTESEERAIGEIINCGVKIITTAHGYSERDVMRRRYIRNIIEDGVFERIIVLGKLRGEIKIEKIITDGRCLRRA